MVLTGDEGLIGGNEPVEEGREREGEAWCFSSPRPSVVMCMQKIIPWGKATHSTQTPISAITTEYRSVAMTTEYSCLPVNNILLPQ